MKNHEFKSNKGLDSLTEFDIRTFDNAAGGKAVFDSSLLSILISNPEGEIIKANNAATRLFGYSFEELYSLGRNDLMHTNAAVMGVILNEIKESGFSKGEMTGVKKNGDHFLMEYSAALLNNLNGTAFCYTMINDISERKRIEAEIEQSNERFELIGKASNDAMWEFNIEKNSLWANLTHQQLYGLTLADPVPDNEEWQSRLHPSEREMVTKSFCDAKESETNIWFAEYRFNAGDKGWLNIYSKIYIEKDQHRKVKRMIGSMMDITYRKSEEEQLKLLESVITNTKDAVLITAAEPFAKPGPKIVFVNKAFREMTGYTSDEVIGQTPWMLQGPKTDRAELDRLSESLSKWESCEITVINYKKNGEEFWSNFSISPVADKNGWYTHWISIQRDVTQSKLSELRLIELNENLQKQAKELAASNLELEHFAYVASHDLQEPLRMVTSFLSLLEKKYKDAIDDRGKKYIFFAVDGAKRMQQIILDLLEFSRIGRTDEKKREIDLNELVVEIKLLLQRKIEEKNAVILVQPLPVINTYKSPIWQVFQNLIGNALKYSREGIPVEIEITAKEFPGYWQFAISDNGIGISSEYFNKIFIIFQRLHNRDAFPGTGIGLAITRKVIEKLGGQIWVESTVGKGSTFYFTILKVNH